MSKDHIGVAINGVLYVKFKDAKKLRKGWDKADAEVEKLRAALQWLVNDLQDYPASARPIAAYDNALEVLGEKE